jgi:choline-sulfatase
MYDPARIPPLRPNGSGKPDFYEAIRKSRRLDRLSETDFLKINSVYLGMISFTDSLLGELLEALERTKHAGDTVVIFCSDHGEWGGDYHLVEKWSSAMDDALTQVPLIIRMPGGPKGRVIGGMVELSDVMATCLDLAGIRAEHTHFARSLLPQLRGAPGDLERAAFSEGGYDRVEPQCFENLKLEPTHIYYPKINLQCEHPETISRTTMMRTLDYKLVMRPDGMGEFYDLKKDPRELHNVYRDRTYDRRREEMQTRMLAWYIRTSDVTPYNLQDNRDMPKANFD